MLNVDLVITELAFLMESVQQFLASFGSTFTTNLGIFTIEVLGNFLKRSVPGLDEEEVDNGQFKSQPAVVDNIVLPCDVLDGNWVDVVVEEQSAVDEEEHDGETLGTNLERKNLDGVTDQETGPSQVVAGIVQVNHSNDSTTSSNASFGLTLLRADCPCNEADQHTTGGKKEKWATSKAIDHESHGTSDNHVPDLKATVDDKLGVLISDTDLVENEIDVVGNERVTGPLREKTSSQADEHPVSVSLGREENFDALVVEFAFEGNSLLDFDKLMADEVVIEVSVGVVLGKNGKSLLMAVDGDQPTWGFWNEPDEANHDTSWTGLEDRWSSPGPVGLDSESSVCGPTGNDGSDVPGGVVDGGDSGTMLHVGQLGDEKWGGTVGKGDTETDQETGTDKHTKVLGSRLEGNTNKHDEETNHDGNSTSSPICEEWGEWDGDNGTDGHDGIEKTELGGCRLEVVLPVVQTLETVHHGTVETIGSGNENDGGEEKVELSKAWFLIPGNCWKFATSQDVTLVGGGSGHGRHDECRLFCLKQKTSSQKPV